MADSQLQHIRIFLSSPSDVAEERAIAIQVIDHLPYDPLLRGKLTAEVVAWDKPGADMPMLATMTPQEAINRGLPLPSDCDIVLVLFWARMGTPLPEDYKKADGSRYLSGTEWEYWDAFHASKATDKPLVVIYRRVEDPVINLKDPKRAEKIEQWEHVEAFFARFTNVDGSIQQGFNSYLSPQDFKQKFEAHIRVLVKQLLETPSLTAPSRQPAQLWHGSPFPGLRAFTPSDEPIFFGRGRETDALVRRLSDSRFVAVVGASGSGKSSLVGAGLIPRLKHNAIEGSKDWMLPDWNSGLAQWIGLRFTPGELGDDPFIAFAARLAPLVNGNVREIAEQLFKHGLTPYLSTLLANRPDWAEIMIFIDQFEELFTLVREEYREPYVNFLVQMLENHPVRIVATIRSDFYHRYINLHQFVELLQYGSFPLGVPQSAALFEMITRPAERAGITFEEGLPERIFEDTRNEPGALALLAYTLDELYQTCRQTGLMTFQAYESMGGVQGAIGKRAESTYASLEPDSQAMLPFVFRELIEVDERGTATRQRATLRQVARNPDAEKLIEAFTRARLLVQSQDSNRAEPIVQVAHEALLQRWDRLTRWISDTYNDFQLLRQVRLAAREWNNTDRNYEDYLWSQERLNAVYAIQERLQIEFPRHVQLFIRPETERLIKEYSDYGVKTHRKLTIIDRLVEIGEPALENLIQLLPLTEPNTLGALKEAIDRFGLKLAPILTKVLATSKSAVLRGHVTLMLSEYGNHEAVPELLKALGDENVFVRAGAIVALRKLGDERSIPALIEVANDSKVEIRRLAIEGLERLKGEPVVDTLIKALKDSEAKIRASAIRALGEIGYQPGVPQIIPLFDDDDLQVRQSVINALGKLPDSRALSTLERALDDVEIEVRRASIAVLDSYLEYPIGPILARALSNSDTDVRRAAVSTLAELKDESTVSALIQSLQDQDAEVRRKAVLALGEFENETAISAIEHLIDDQDPRVRQNTVEALAKRPDDKRLAFIVRVLEDSDASVRLAAVSALGHFGSDQALVPLMQIASNEDSAERLRLAAIQALGNSGNPTALPLLIELGTRGSNAER
ncbi:MAG: HEAT repeat domain-containing protein [Anaerolineae bacterium]|nr:HEAT repeat domain-containing protein [Anaerolineae bacterium]